VLYNLGDVLIRLGRSAELVDELQAELDRLRALQSPDSP